MTHRKFASLLALATLCALANPAMAQNWQILSPMGEFDELAVDTDSLQLNAAGRPSGWFRYNHVTPQKSADGPNDPGTRSTALQYEANCAKRTYRYTAGRAYVEKDAVGTPVLSAKGKENAPFKRVVPGGPGEFIIAQLCNAAIKPRPIPAWQVLGTNSQGETLLVDADTLQVNPAGLSSGWFRIEKSGQTLPPSQSKFEVDCPKHSWRILEMRDLDGNDVLGMPLSSVKGAAEFAPARAGSNAAGVVERLCATPAEDGTTPQRKPAQ